MNADQRKGETMAEVMYPSVTHQKDGKKFEPSTAAFSPKLAARMGKGHGPGPYDEAPPELKDVNWNEVGAVSLTDLAAAMHLGGRQFERPAEFEEAQKAMMALGFGITMARAALAFVKRTAQHGAPPFSSDDARKALVERWGDDTDKNLAEVKALVADGSAKWPGLGRWLTEQGMGNDPHFIAFLHKAARRRKERSYG